MVYVPLFISVLPLKSRSGFVATDTLLMGPVLSLERHALVFDEYEADVLNIFMCQDSTNFASKSV